MTQERILVVDGDVALAEMLKTRLEERGYLVECASNGSKVMGIIKDKWIDLIVLAISLQGGIDGFQLLKEIKKKKAYSKIPVIVQSSKAAMKKTFEMIGVEAFFIKPYPMDLFLDEIKDILTKKILVLSSDKRIQEEIRHKLAGYDVEVDALDNINKFYANITLYRYCLVIIYTTKRSSELDKGEAAKIRLLRERCQSLGPCEFMDRGYSNKQFLELSKKYLKFL